MKRILATVIAALFIAYGSAGGTGVVAAVTSTQTEDAIKTIRQHYATINKRASKYRKVKKDLSGFSAEGGEMVAYFDGSSIAKIVNNYYGESGRASEEYYYWNEKLIFVFRKDYGYDTPMSGKVVSTTESRFYFNNDRLIRWIDENGKQIAPSSSEYQDKQSEYLQSSRKFVEAARSPKPTVEAFNKNAPLRVTSRRIRA